MSGSSSQKATGGVLVGVLGVCGVGAKAAGTAAKVGGAAVKVGGAAAAVELGSGASRAARYGFSAASETGLAAREAAALGRGAVSGIDEAAVLGRVALEADEVGAAGRAVRVGGEASSLGRTANRATTLGRAGVSAETVAYRQAAREAGLGGHAAGDVWVHQNGVSRNLSAIERAKAADAARAAKVDRFFRAHGHPIADHALDLADLADHGLDFIGTDDGDER